MMTQRIFDVENEKDMQDLWDILPDEIIRIRDTSAAYKEGFYSYEAEKNKDYYITSMLKINWHDKTEITRPIQEAAEKDIGKLCNFALKEPAHNINCGFGILTEIKKGEDGQTLYLKDVEMWYNSCRRLTKQEIEELC